jgi:dihydrofolate reductase
MRKVVTNTFVSLDGVMQAPGGPDEDPSGGFTQGGWSVSYWDDQMGDEMSSFMGKPFDLLLGRRTYEIFAGYWPKHADVPGGAELNKARKHVASRTLDRVDWENSTLIEGNVADSIRALKDQEGPEIQVHGSGDLIQTLLEHDLIDEMRVWIFPVLLGSGKRLFGTGTVPAALRLTDSKTSSTGVIMATFERAGAVTYGSFAVEQPAEVSA